MLPIAPPRDLFWGFTSRWFGKTWKEFRVSEKELLELPDPVFRVLMDVATHRKVPGWVSRKMHNVSIRRELDDGLAAAWRQVPSGEDQPTKEWKPRKIVGRRLVR